MHPKETFHLSIQFSDSLDSMNSAIKADVRDWLIGIGEESFVDGVIDDLYLDLDYGSNAHDQFELMGGDILPISIYKYDRAYLDRLIVSLEENFGTSIQCELGSLETVTWMEGWKESFKPLQTNRFYIYPPWLGENIPPQHIPLVIEPGMAFGTGQHATTLLCLGALEILESLHHSKENLLDVGTGTGILAIAAKKLGYKEVFATDIDPDSIIATNQNAQDNFVELQLHQGSVPCEDTLFEVVIANIIFYVLRKMVGDLSRVAKEDGFVVLSGVLVEEARTMELHAKDAGLFLIQEAFRDDWACQIYRKRS